MNKEDNRRHDRITTHRLPFTLACINEKNQVVFQGTGWTLDVSESGLLIETDFFIEPNKILLITIPIENDIADIKGEVVHCSDNGNRKFKVGIKFLEIEWLYNF